jgi:hypothetical protein
MPFARSLRFALLALLLSPALAAADDVVHTCQATLLDGYRRPVGGARVQFKIETYDHPSQVLDSREAVTDEDGRAVLPIPWDADEPVLLKCKIFGEGLTHRIRDNSGQIGYHAGGVEGAEVHVNAEMAPQWSAVVDSPGLVTGPEDRHGSAKSRLYLSADGIYDRVVLIPQGFDFFERNEGGREDADRMWFTYSRALKPLYEAGFDVWLFKPYLTGSNIHEQAAEFAQAIQSAASHAGGARDGKVIVAGYSLGGLVARLTTARWEVDAEWRASLGLVPEMPVNLVAFADAALRGANVSVSIQEYLWDKNVATKVNLASCAAFQLLRENSEDGRISHGFFFESGARVEFQGATGTCDRTEGTKCVCDAGPAVEHIGGDGFPDGPELYAFSAGTWSPPLNLCYGGEKDWNDREQDICPQDPGVNGLFAPQPGDHWMSIRWLVSGLPPMGSQHFAGWGEDLAPGSRFALAFEKEPRIREILPPPPGGVGELDVIHNWSFTFIPIVSALAGDSPEQVPFAPGHTNTGTYQAAHNRPEPYLWGWLIDRFKAAYGGGEPGPGPGGYPPAAPGNVVADPLIGEWDQIDITWEDRSTNEDRFEVQRKLGANGAWQRVEFVPANETSYRDRVPEMPGTGGTLFYFYRVLAYNNYGHAISNRAEARMYADPPGRANTLRPRGCTDELLPTLSWRGGGRTSKFYVRLLDAATAEEAMPDVKVRENEVRVSRPLAARRPYLLRVWGMNNAGWGTGSSPEFFRTFCEEVDPPEWLEPVGCIDDLTPVARWTEVPGALSYHVRIYEMGTGPGGSDRLVVDAGPSGTSVEIPAGSLHAGKDYRAWVKPHTAGSSDPYSRIRFFTPMCGQASGAGFVSPIAPNDAVVSTDHPEFVFEPASRADSYRLEVYNETGTVLVYAREYTAASICAGESCSVRPDQALVPGRHAWWVRAGRGSVFDPTAIWSWVRVPALPAVSVGGASASEADGTLAFQIALSAPAQTPVTVTLRSEQGSALETKDYLPLAGQWTLPVGSTTLPVVVPLVDDVVHEGSESLALRLTAANGALLGQQVGTGTIADDDPQPRLSIGDATVVEGAHGSSTLELELSLTGATDLPVSALLESRDCSALAGEDYVAPTAEQIVLAPGEKVRGIKYEVLGDTVFEGDELFVATLSAPTGAELVDGWGQGRIRNDDPRGRGDRRPQRPHADFDGNGRGDLLFRHSVSGQIAVWLLDGSERIGGGMVQSTASPNADWQIVATGDLDHNASTDLVWRNRNSGNLAFWYMTGLVHSSGATLAGEEELAWEVAGAGDFDLDGWVDLLWRHAESGELQIWRMRNQEILERLPIVKAPGADPRAQVAAVADFDGNTAPDLLWRDEDGKLRLWLLDGNRFVEEQDLDPALLGDANWGIAGAWDVDDDGWNDLVLQHAISGKLVVWYLTANRRSCGAYPKPDAPVDPRWQLTGLR